VTQRWLPRAKFAWPLLIVAILGALVGASALFATSTPTNSAQHPPIKDLYEGIATLDENGEATIELPSSVAAEHRSFTYQAKAIGSSCRTSSSNQS
jgi:heme A synthase